jgi:predicted nucleic acid-binding protein
MRVAIVDTCCLINLYASQHLPAIVAASIEQAFVPKAVLSECLYIRQQSEDNANRLIPVSVDLHPLIHAGILLLTDLTGEVELDEFVRLAAVVDDCEAVCLTIAAVREWALATDDRRAIQVAMDLGVSVVTTPELLKNWAERASPEQHEVTEAVMCIEKYGRFHPHNMCAYASWWAEQRLP